MYLKCLYVSNRLSQCITKFISRCVQIIVIYKRLKKKKKYYLKYELHLPNRTDDYHA